MAKFKRTEIAQFPKFATGLTEGNSWGRLEHPITVKEYGAINRLDTTPEAPNLLAITSYSKVQIYNTEINEVQKTFMKFQDAAFGARFRRDGKLICVGTSEGQVKVFDVASKTLLRILRGHTNTTHRCDFTTNGTHVVSFSDDKSVGLWDLPSETKIETFFQHTDYVRSGCVSGSSSDLIVSGSYDHTVKVWDRRVGGAEAVMSIDHGDMVEDVLLLPGDGMLVSAGGNHVKFWDLVGGGRLLSSISPHHKTVTCLTLADRGSCVVSGGLDRQVKKIDIKSFKPVGSISYPSDVLSVAVSSPDSKTVAAGMIDGLVQIHHRKDETAAGDGGGRLNARQARNQGSHKYLRFTQFNPSAGDVVVADSRNDVELRHDHLLRKYEYTKALNQVLKPFVQRKKPEYAYSLLYELMRRKGLTTALAGRDEKGLSLVLTFLNRYIVDVRFSNLLIHVAEIVVELYLPNHGMSDRIDKLFADLERKLQKAARYIEELSKLQGSIDLVLAASEENPIGHRIEEIIFGLENGGAISEL